MPSKRICVIGAGCSGLPCIKACVEAGFNVVCYEQRSEIGGLWNYKEDLPTEWSTVMRSTIINTSKEMMAFSDYPPPTHYPNFMHNSVLKEYIDDYAAHFDLIRHIRFNTVVTKVKKAADYHDTGRYEVFTKNYAGDGADSNGSNEDCSATEAMEVFDGVMVASGHHSKPNIPQIAGIHKFQGTVKHSQSYKNPDAYRNRRVLVVGVGNSGLDAAIDLTRSCTNQVYVSTRRGSWIWNRVSKRGFPYDTFYLTKFYDLAIKYLGVTLTSWLLQHALNGRFDHQLYRMRPKHRFFSAHPTVNDSLPNAICSGQLMIRGDIKDFSKNAVTFDDDSEVEIDEVILSTGYSFTFPFLESGLLRCENNKVDLYKYVFPPHLPHGSLSFIGYVQPMGAIQPISELQARWATRILSNAQKLPKRSEMTDDIQRKRLAMARQFIKSPRHTVQVRYVDYMSEISTIIGCNPFWSPELALSKPKLFYNIFFGPCTPYIFRIIGPNKWAGAEDAVKSTLDRVIAPLAGVDADEQTKASIKQKFYYFGTSNLTWCLIVGLLLVLGCLCVTFESMWPITVPLISATVLALIIGFIVDIVY